MRAYIITGVISKVSRELSGSRFRSRNYQELNAIKFTIARRQLPARCRTDVRRY